MAKETVTAPKYREFREIPVIVEGAMADSKPYAAKPAHQESVGFPGELVDNWQDVAVKKLGELVSGSRALQVFLDTCVKCGACTDKCHYYIGTQDPNNMPVARQDLLRKVYRRHYTFAGKYFPKLVGALDFTEEVRDLWYSYFHQCSQCRRCSVFCPYGIDTAEISMAGREVLDSIGVGQKYCNEILGKVHKIGNNLGLPEPALVDTLEGLEEDLEDDTGHKIRVPVDEKGAEVLLITPSADFFAEPHIDGLMGYAKVFHQAGISWTLSSYASEAANFSMFIGSHENLKKAAMRIREAALELGVKRIVVGECGHAWRVAYSFWNTLIGPFDFLDKAYPSPSHICEVTYGLLQNGAIKL
ncbi:MAG: (Fe-S)-binding protein, partial [Gammaproteobacteria bacterium]